MKRQVNLSLSYPFLYTWKTSGDISVLSNSEPASIFKHFSDVSSVESALTALNIIHDNFALVKETDQFLFAAVDRVRSFPMFYKIDENAICITDDILSIEKPVVLDKTAEQDLQNIFCVSGQSTLLKNWKQLQPGELLFYDKQNEKLNVHRYFNFKQRPSAFTMDLVNIKINYLQVFSQIIYDAKERPLIVPLSGGYDSRCIVACLKMLDAKNIFCYTYGCKDSFEKEIAEKVAKQLNLNWHFVEYTDNLLDTFFTDKWQNYSDKNHHFTSLPHEQDFFALCELDQKGLLPKNGIVLPGFLGDYFAGSMFKDISVQDASQYQDQYISNRGCKFIVNAVRLYEYFGLEWRLPFADKDLIDTWLSVSLQERLFKNGYNDAMSEIFFKPLQIDFKKQDHEYTVSSFKKFIRSVLPESLKDLIRGQNTWSPQNDPNNTHYLYKKLKERGGEPVKNVKNNFNRAHAAYFLQRLAEKLATLEKNNNS